MTENTWQTNDYNAVQPNGEATADRWSAALHLFDEQSAAPAASADVDGADVDSTHSDGAAPNSSNMTAANWERGELLFEAKDYRAAARLLALVVDDVPEQVAPRLLLARAYYHSAQLRRAEEQLRAVIERDPVEHYAYLMLGRTLERQGRHDEAATWLRTASALE